MLFSSSCLIAFAFLAQVGIQFTFIIENKPAKQGYVMQNYGYFLAVFHVTSLFLFLSLNTQADEIQYKPQNFFDNGDSGVFYDLKSGELLKAIIEQNRTVLIEQDGDIFEEDVATLDDEILGLSSQQSFSKSKRVLGKKIYPTHLIAFYSGCRYRLKEKKFIPIASSCGFKYRKNKNRAQRIEWEHIVPAWHFGHQLRCWQKGGRLHCRNSNAKFKQMEADMHNLVPAIGEINGDRSNFKYRMLAGEMRLYGKPVNMEISFKERAAEPPDNVQGDIARTYFYMADRYGLQISEQQKKLFIAWNNRDPVDSWERKKNQLVKKLQGDENLYITHYKKLKQGDIVTSAPSTSFAEINHNLKQQFGFLFDYLPAWLVESILVIATLFLLWRHKRSKSKFEKIEKQATRKKKAENKAVTPKKSHSKKSKKSVKKYLIQSRMVERVLSLNKEQRLVIKNKQNDDSQYWQLVESNKTEGFVFIQHVATGKVLEIEGGLKKDHTKVILGDKKRRDNNHQEWRLVVTEGPKYFFLENRATQTVLDIRYKKRKQGSKVASYHKKSRGTENQEWELIRV